MLTYGLRAGHIVVAVCLTIMMLALRMLYYRRQCLASLFTDRLEIDMEHTLVIDLDSWDDLADVAGVIIEKLGETPRI
jgi:hypothetical protein